MERETEHKEAGIEKAVKLTQKEWGLVLETIERLEEEYNYAKDAEEIAGLDDLKKRIRAQIG